MNINRYINFSRLLTLNYKKIGLSDDEYLLLIITYELVQTGTKFVNPSDLSLLCNFTPTKIDVVYSGLIAKKLISNEFSKSNTVYTSFDGIVKKLLSCLEDEVDEQEAKIRKPKLLKKIFLNICKTSLIDHYLHLNMMLFKCGKVKSMNLL